MTRLVLVRRFLTDYARNPVNLLLLVVVPTAFVIVVAGSMADAARLLGGVGGPAVETAAAGWAAAFLAGIAMYFQTAGTRDTDRRLIIAGLSARRLALSRLATGLALAVLASAAALVALAGRTGIDHPVRVVAGTMLFAATYVAIGAVVGALAPNPVNGTVIVLFVWILDVFFGPAMGAADRITTRGLPTHFATLWMVDLPSGHGGRIGDLGWAVAWTTAAGLIAWTIVSARVGVPPRRRRAAASVRRGQRTAALRAAWRDARRNPVQWVLFVVVPVVFVLTAAAVTPDEPITLTLREHGRTVTRVLAMDAVHGATMAPIAIASLAALVGLFGLLDSRAGDRRAALAGLPPTSLLTARLAVLSLMTITAAAVSLTATALVFDATRWPTFIAANLLLGLTYALVGGLLAPTLGRVGGVFVAFLLPFLDIGIVQSPMLHATPTAMSRFLPGYGGSRVLLDGALTRGFDESTPLLLGVAWLLALLGVVAVVYRRACRPSSATSSRSPVSARGEHRRPVATSASTHSRTVMPAPGSGRRPP